MSEIILPAAENKNNSAALTSAKVEKKVYTSVDKIYTIIFCVVGRLFIKFVFGTGINQNYEVNVFIFTLIYITAVLSYARFKRVTPAKESYVWLLVMLFISVPYMFYSFFGSWQVIALVLVAAYWTVSVGGCLIKNESSEWIVLDGLHSLVSLPFGNFFSIFSAAFPKKSTVKKDSSIAIKNFGAIILGFVFAAAFLWVIIPLLYKADQNFLSIFKSLKFDFKFNLENFIAADFIPSALVTLYLFGLASGAFNQTRPTFLQNNSCETERNKCRFASVYTLKIFIYAICGVYILFIFLQASYLFSAFKGVLYKNMTYAQYAKNGFFELCRVCGINIGVLAVCNLFNTHKENKNIKLPVIVLASISLVLLSTAGAKLVMYISAYGFTPKRIAGLVALIWLFTVFLLIILRFFKNFKLTKIAVFTAAFAFCLLCVIDINSLSKGYNLSHGFEENSYNYYQSLDDFNF